MPVYVMRRGTRQTISIEAAVAVRTLAEACATDHDTQTLSAVDTRAMRGELHPTQVTGPGGEPLQG